MKTTFGVSVCERASRTLAMGVTAAAIGLALPASASAQVRSDLMEPGAAATSISTALPHDLPDLAPRLEQHSRRGGGGSGGSGGSGGGGQAVPRGGSGGGSTGGGQSGGSSGGSSGGNSGGGARTRAGTGSPGTTGSSGSSGTPTYSKPRDGRPAAGTAVERGDGQRGGTTTIVTGGGYYGGFYPWGWGGLGLGGYYGYYDPWGWGTPYPPVVYYDHDGGLKLKITPRHAEVYVDGYFAGSVDDYDGLFQKLGLNPGPHRIEVRLDGYEPLFFDVRIDPGRTVTYKGELRRRGDGAIEREDDRDRVR